MKKCILFMTLVVTLGITTEYLFSRDGNQSLETAVATETEKAEKIVKRLLGSNATLTSRDESGRTALQLAIFFGKLADARILIKAGADVNTIDDKGWSPLHLAAISGYDALVKLLIEAGADIDPVMLGDGWTPLQMAASYGYEGIVRYLIECGADIENKKIKKGDTVLHTAVSRGKIEIVKLLLAAQADVNVRTSDGWSPLHTAAQKGHPEIAQLLLDSGTDVNAVDKNGFTPLHVAVAIGDSNIVEVLLKNHANLTIKDWLTQQTPLELAVVAEYTKIVILLLDHGAEGLSSSEKMRYQLLRFVGNLPRYALIGCGTAAVAASTVALIKKGFNEIHDLYKAFRARMKGPKAKKPRTK